MTKIIVTGGAGFIGSHLVDKLIEQNYEVVVVDNLLLGKKEFINKKAKFKKADIRDLEKMKKIFRGAEVVFHLAADPRLPVSVEDPIQTHNINVNGTLNVLMAAKNVGVKKVIFSSSCAVYGDQSVPIKETAIPKPLSPYGLHKLIGEEYCRLFNQLYGLSTVCLRYFNVFGPRKLATGSYPMVIPIFLAQKKKQQPLTIVGDGKATRDYVHVSDVVQANIQAWQSAVVDGRAINIGAGQQTSVNDIAKIIGGAIINIPERKGEARFIEANNTLAKELINWQPQVILTDGIKQLMKDVV
jgi:UDP-glucose 4-epimerase